MNKITWQCFGFGALLLALLVGASACAKEDPNKAIEDAAPAIQETIQGFSKAMSENDQITALDYFGIEKILAGYDAEKAKERLGGVEVEAPTMLSKTQEASDDMGTFMAGFLLDDSQSLPDLNTETISKLWEDIKNLRLLRIDIPMPEASSQDSALKNYHRRAAVYGADNFVYRSAFYELNGKTYACGFGLLQYGDEWFIDEVHCALLGMPSAISTFPISEEGYKALIADKKTEAEASKSSEE